MNDKKIIIPEEDVKTKTKEEIAKIIADALKDIIEEEEEEKNRNETEIIGKMDKERNVSVSVDFKDKHCALTTTLLIVDSIIKRFGIKIDDFANMYKKQLEKFPQKNKKVKYLHFKKFNV